MICGRYHNVMAHAHLVYVAEVVMLDVLVLISLSCCISVFFHPFHSVVVQLAPVSRPAR